MTFHWGLSEAATVMLVAIIIHAIIDVYWIWRQGQRRKNGDAGKTP
jgi:hypothetical protein